jgi:tripartite-type tricarboxylate transporter receptor subunit TctC
MRLRRRRFLHLFAGAAVLPAVSRIASAQGYPSRPITIVVPFGPGSATDTVARSIALPLGIALKQNVVIETKPGANGTIAANQVARAAPDGYTLILSTNTPHSAAASLVKSISYDPVKDFTALSRVGSFTQMLVLHPDLPVKSIPELIAHAKANPGKLSFASGNASAVVAGETLKRWAGLDIVHVPYRSTPPALNDVLGGRVSMMFADLTTGLPHVRAGTLRALASTRLQRSTLFPELPSMHEAGITNFDMDSWAGMFAPANTPREIVMRLNAELRRIIDDAEMRGRLGAVGFEAFSSTPDELGEFVKVQLVKWTRMIKDAGIVPE